MLDTGNKTNKMGVGIGRVEANYIATNPKIFEELKIGDILICVHKDDYFRMQERTEELM